MNSLSARNAVPAGADQVYQDLMDRLLFETLLTEISARFVRAPATSVDSEIERSQKEICECLGLDHSSVWQIYSQRPGTFLLTHVYRSRTDLAPVPDEMDGFEVFPWVSSKLVRNQVIDVADTSKTPPEASRDRATWQHFGVRSALAIPLRIADNPVFGVLSFESTRETREWPEELRSRLSLIAQVFANALERKFADQRLRESEARLVLVANSAQAGLWSLEISSGKMWASDSAKTLFSFPIDAELSLAEFLARVHPEDRPAVQRAINQAIQSCVETAVEYRAILPDGSERWLVSRGRAHRYGEDEPRTLMGITTDVTDIRRAERERSELAGKLLHAQELECTRIARELHDDLGQRVSLVSMHFQRALEKLEAGAPDIQALREVGGGLTEIGHRISALSHQLHSSELEHLGLAAAATYLCRELTEQWGLPISCSCALPGRLESGIELSLYRILQEALRNAIRHGQASTVEVSLGISEAAVYLRVADNGQGFDTNRSFAGLGLTSMRERARLVGGECSVQSRKGAGTTIKATVPRELPRS